MDRQLNLKQICEKHRLSESAVRAKLHHKAPRTLPMPETLRVGGRVYCDEDAFVAWIHSPARQKGRPRVRPIQ